MLGNMPDPLDELIYIVLSTRTQGKTFLRTFRSLKESFPEWKDVLDAPASEIEAILRPGGLSVKKTTWIKQLLSNIQELEDQVSLDSLRSMSDDDVERYLVSLPGIGLKTARCVMMYSLGRQTLPVDANVKRIFERLGVVDTGIHYSKIHDEVQELVPGEIRAPLHIYCVIHGRKICTPYKPSCTACPLLQYCDFGAERLDVLAHSG